MNSSLQRTGSNATKGDSLNDNAEDSSIDNVKPSNVNEPVRPASSLVFGYLNLFSDGVVSCINLLLVELRESFPLFMQTLLILQHNFTDGIALGSAFMLYGSVGGWSRTLFLLAHEIPQEVQIHPYLIT